MKRILTALALLFLMASFAFATSYKIESYVFNITGRTREQALRELVANDEGEKIFSLETLEKALEDKTMALLSKRLFSNVYASWESVGTEEDTTLVKVRFDIEGTISAFVAPGFAYDSNTGMLFNFCGADQNFLGSMKESSFAFEFKQLDGTFGNSRLLANVKTWFRLGNVDNRVSLSTYVYSKDKSEDIISLELTSYFRRVHTKVSVTAKDPLSKKIMLSPQLSVTVGLGKLFGIGLSANLKAGLSFKGLSYEGYSQSLTFSARRDNVQWKGDFRTGYDIGLDVVARGNGELDLTLNAMVYDMPFSWMNTHSRLVLKVANHMDRDANSNFSKYIRGVRNDNAVFRQARFNSALALNGSIMLKAISVEKVGKIYINPFFDMGMIATASGEFLASAGLEVLVILDQWPGLPYRIALGRNIINPNEWELIIDASFYF